MTEAATAPAASKKDRKPKPNGAPKKERKPRASNVAVGFAQKVEQAAANKINDAGTALADAISVQVNEFTEKLIGENFTPEDATALLTISIGARVGVSKIGIAAARNKIQPALAEAMLAKLGV